ncbi:hypothetical protein [Actinomadura fibrosa]|uniref:Tetratricopeptide repeat protein n=1 Tax=Actinomadura fibrosa TaxID=111802 RepID=A0ABW2XBG5_9ACTN
MPAGPETELISELATLVTHVDDTGDPMPLRELLAEARRRSGVRPATVLRVECELEKWLSRDRDAALSAEVWATLARRAAEERVAARDPAYLAIRALHAQYVRRRGRPGDADLAVGLYEREHALRTRLFPPDDPRISTVHANLAMAIRERGRPGDLERALEMLEREAALRTRTHGSGRPFTWIAQLVLAQTLVARAEEAAAADDRRAFAGQAAEHSEHVLAGRRLRFGGSHPATLRAQLVHAHALLLLERGAEAVELLRAHQRQDPAAAVSPGKSDLLLARALRDADPAAALLHARRAAHRGADPRRRQEAERLARRLSGA